MTEHENQMQESTSAPNDVIESVRDLIEMMNKGGIGELDVSAGDVSIFLRTETVALAAATPVMVSAPTPASYAPVHTDVSATTNVTQVPSITPMPEGHIVSSPMIGTFYAASAPGEPSFAQIGDEVETGQVIGIIEAMKIMNEITADKSGVIVEIMIENAQAVEYGSPLVRIADSAGID